MQVSHRLMNNVIGNTLESFIKQCKNSQARLDTISIRENGYSFY